MADFNLAAEEVQFVKDVSGATGVDPHLVAAWITAEGAYAPGGTGGHNFLNLRPYKSDVGVVGQSGGGFDQFVNERAAALSSIARIKQPFLWTSPELGGPGLGAVISAHGDAVAQAQAIGRSGWDAGHYGSPPGSKLVADLASTNKGGPSLGKSVVTATGDLVTGNPVGAAGAVAQGAGAIASGIGLGGVGSAVGGVGAALSAPEKIYKFLTSYRFLELVGGLVLVVLGLVILGRAIATSSGIVSVGQAVSDIKRGGVAAKSRAGGDSGSSEGPISQAPRRVQRRAGFEGPARRPSRRAAARAAASRARQSEEIPF